MRTYKRNGIYYISFDTGRKARWTSTGLRNYADVIHKYREATAITPAHTQKLSDFIPEYLERISPMIRKGTGRTYRFVLEEFLRIVGDKQLSSLDSDDVHKFTQSRIRQHIEPSTINTQLRYLRAFFKKAQRWDFISAIPDVPLLRVVTPPPKYITEEELKSILILTKDRTLQHMFRFTFFTGLRLAEVINLPWVNCSVKRKQVIVSPYKDFDTKSGRTRTVPLSEMGLFSLSGMRKIDRDRCGHLFEYVFTHSGGKRYSPPYVSDIFTKLARKAGLEGVHFHTLRHSTASLLVQKGVSLYVVQALLGHSSIRTTEQYSHLAPSTLKKGIDAFDEGD